MYLFYFCSHLVFIHNVKNFYNSSCFYIYYIKNFFKTQMSSFMVGVAGIEPATSWSQTTRSTN